MIAEYQLADFQNKNIRYLIKPQDPSEHLSLELQRILSLHLHNVMHGTKASRMMTDEEYHFMGPQCHIARSLIDSHPQFVITPTGVLYQVVAKYTNGLERHPGGVLDNDYQCWKYASASESGIFDVVYSAYQMPASWTSVFPFTQPHNYSGMSEWVDAALSIVTDHLDKYNNRLTFKKLKM